MVHVRNVCTRSFSLLVLVLVAGFAAPSVQAQYEYEWGKALLDLRLDDMAEKVFTDLSKSSTVEMKNQGLTGLALLKRNAAQRSKDVTERNTLNSEALATLEEVSKQLKATSPEYWDTKFALADMLQEVANEDIDLIEKGLVPADKIQSVIDTNLNRLLKAENIYVTARSDFADAEAKSEEASIRDRATLNHFVLQLRRAWLTGTDDKKRRAPSRIAALNDLRDELAAFATANDTFVFGYYGWYWLARTLAELSRSTDSVKPSEVVDYYEYVLQDLTRTPEEVKEDGGEWKPLRTDLRNLVQNTYWKMLEFMNQQGWTSRVIQSGEKMRRVWAKSNYEFSILGDLALIELANAYHNEGRSGAALEIAANISKEGGYQGQQADKLMSSIINASVSKENFDPKLLMAGANGARIAAIRNPAKNSEAIELYRGVLENLEKIEDPIERNDTGRQAGYQIGRALDRMGRKLEAAMALEATYKRFNNDQIREDPKLNETISKLWRAILREFDDATKGSAFAKGLRNEADDYVAANAPKGQGGDLSVVELQWKLAESARRQKDWQKAIEGYVELIKNPSEYQERAMVKKAIVEFAILGDKKNATADEWQNVAKLFEDYKEHARTTEETDPTRLKARKAALTDADLQIASALARAVDAAKDDAKKEALNQRILSITKGFSSRTKDANAAQYVRFVRFQALADTGQVDEAEAIFNEMVAENADDKNVPRAALALYRILKGRADTMTTLSEEARAKRQAVYVRAADAYTKWLLNKNPNKAGNWTPGYKYFVEAGEWDKAYTVLRKAIEKFDGKRGQEKSVKLMRRRLGTVLLEKAKLAFLADDKSNAEELFKEASSIYKELVGDPPKGPRSVLAEAAEVFGGFIVGPDSRGNYSHFSGTAEFDKASEIWGKLKSWSKKPGKTPEETLENQELNKKADFYVYLMNYKIAQAEKDDARLRYIKKNVKAKFDKTKEPGGPKWVNQWKWLRNEL